MSADLPPALLSDAAQAWLCDDAISGWVLGLSGGVDSVALLHTLSVFREEAHKTLRAVHVHHGLSPYADEWAVFCEALCAKYAVPFSLERCQLEKAPNLEARAREVRYAAFNKHLEPGSALVSAHHQNDQAETLLLRLMRGAGVRGLGGMRASRALGKGVLLRPLLEVSRAQIEAYAGAHGLRWIEDESNAELGFDRNYLRHTVLPVLAERWPDADAQIAQSAGWCQQADVLLAEYGAEDLASARLPDARSWLDVCVPLDFSVLQGFGKARQRHLLTQWWRALSDTALPGERLDEWLRQVGEAGSEQSPRLVLGERELALYQERLHILSATRTASFADQQWRVGEAPLRFSALPFVLHAEGAVGEALSVRWRCGGEKIFFPGGRKSLKKMLQAARVPPWERDALPMVYAQGTLLWTAWFGDSEEKKTSDKYQKVKFSLCAV